MATRKNISAAAAGGLLLLGCTFYYLLKEPQFRRGPLIEAAAWLRIASTYEASYEDCADERVERNGLSGLAYAFVSSPGHSFPALSDADAVAYARAALPSCRLDMLMRRPRFGWTPAQRNVLRAVDIAG